MANKQYDNAFTDLWTSRKAVLAVCRSKSVYEDVLVVVYAAFCLFLAVRSLPLYL